MMAQQLDPNPLLTAALAYAARGWHVFPVHWPDPAQPGGCSCGADPCSSPGKHPVIKNGLNGASRWDRQVRSWWEANPHANVGVRTGAVSGFIVLDVDTKLNGIDAVVELEMERGSLPQTLTAQTGGGGLHYLFRHPGFRVANDATGKLGIGVDVRGDGGYIVAAPSLHISNRSYEWLNDLPIAALPQAWIDLLPRPAVHVVRDIDDSPIPAVSDDDAAYWLDQAFLRARRGTRNATGFWLACQLRDAGMGEGDAAPVLDSYASRVGGSDYTPAEARKSLGQAYKQAPREKAVSQEPRAQIRIVRGNRVNTGTGEVMAEEDPEEEEEEEEEDAEPVPASMPLRAEKNLTDLGNAQRLVTNYGENLRYVPEWGWLAWNGAYWERDATGTAERYARDVVRDLYNEARAQRKKGQRKQARQTAAWAFKSEAASRLTAMVQVAQVDLGVVARPDQFDTDPWLLTCANGVLDLRTGALREAQRGGLATRATTVAYNPDATAPTWTAFLMKVLPDQEVQDFIQRFAGYSLTGLTREQCLLFLYGSGSNGKSTLLGLLQQVLGTFATQTAPETLMVKQQGGGINNDIAALAGLRMVTTIEVEDGKRLAENLIKSLTGQDLITARFLHKEYFSFRPAFKVWLAANHKPVIRGTDYAIWRRVHLVPFNVLITEEEKQADPHFGERLATELPGILRWCVDGCLAWQQHGLQVPDAVQEATQAYREEMDVLGPFLDECCERDSHEEVLAGFLYAIYIAWSQDNGDEPLKQRTFGLKLMDRGFEQKRGTGGKRLWRGLFVKSEYLHLSMRNKPVNIVQKATSDASDTSDAWL